MKKHYRTLYLYPLTLAVLLSSQAALAATPPTATTTPSKPAQAGSSTTANPTTPNTTATTSNPNPNATKSTANVLEKTPEFRQMNNGFGSMLLNITDMEAFNREWNQTEKTPNIKPADSVRLGQSIHSLVLFAGCRGGADKMCKMSVQFRLRQPNQPVMDIPAHNFDIEEAANPDLMRISPAVLKLGVEDTDPVGRWEIEATVIDKISKRRVVVKSHYMVVK